MRERENSVNVMSEQTRIVLYPENGDGEYVCVVEAWNGERYIETNLKAAHEKALYAFIDCKRNAILDEIWVEQHDAPDLITRRSSRRRRARA